jgi:hypothetical protein
VKVHYMKRFEFIDLALHQESELMRIINEPDAIIVKQMYDPKSLLDLRARAFKWGTTSEPSWAPCIDGCPDYHRLHDNYPQAHVKQKMHAFYWHGWYPENDALMAMFSDIFDVKNSMAGMPPGSYIKNIPSDGQIVRLLIHHYPQGGGYQMEHIDPTSRFARIQTLVMASQIGKDFYVGGIYARPQPDAEAQYLDQYTNVGDMIVISPGIQHGVAYIDPECEYAWQENKGRWMILPIIVNSDYDRPDNVKPRGVGA